MTEDFTHRLTILAGQPLSKAAGYAPIESFTVKTSDNIEVPLIRMGKSI